MPRIKKRKRRSINDDQSGVTVEEYDTADSSDSAGNRDKSGVTAIPSGEASGVSGAPPRDLSGVGQRRR
jgi:hypothetical protein